MKSYDEIARNVLAKRDAHRQQMHRRYATIAATAASVAVVCILGTIAWGAYMVLKRPAVEDESSWISSGEVTGGLAQQQSKTDYAVVGSDGSTDSADTNAGKEQSGGAATSNGGTTASNGAVGSGTGGSTTGASAPPDGTSDAAEGTGSADGGGATSNSGSGNSAGTSSENIAPVQQLTGVVILGKVDAETIVDGATCYDITVMHCYTEIAVEQTIRIFVREGCELTVGESYGLALEYCAFDGTYPEGNYPKDDGAGVFAPDGEGTYVNAQGTPFAAYVAMLRDSE